MYICMYILTLLLLHVLMKELVKFYCMKSDRYTWICLKYIYFIKNVTTPKSYILDKSTRRFVKYLIATGELFIGENLSRNIHIYTLCHKCHEFNRLQKPNRKICRRPISGVDIPRGKWIKGRPSSHGVKKELASNHSTYACIESFENIPCCIIEWGVVYGYPLWFAWQSSHCYHAKFTYLFGCIFDIVITVQ